MREVIDSANTAAFSSCSGLVAGKADRPEDLAHKLTFSKAVGESYCSFAYSVLACFKTGMSGSASFHNVRKS